MRFLRPKTLNEAARYKAETGYPLIAGGTDLVAQWKGGAPRPEGVINISGITALSKIKEDGDLIIIGSTATHAEIRDSSLVKDNLPALAKACSTVGAAQIQNIGTIGGNIMNASPAGDTLPVLLAHEAEVELAGLKKKRRVAFGGLYTGYRKTVLAGDEVLSRIIVKKQAKGEVSDFLKIGTRRAQAISKVCACFRRHGLSFAIAFGSVAPFPVRCSKTEAFLKGKDMTTAVIDESVKIIEGEISPIDDIRSTGDYRAHVCGALFRRFLISIG